MLVEITQEDIDNGGQTPDQCPVARAINRAALGQKTWVNPPNAQVSYQDKKGWRVHIYRLPQDAINWIATYDDSGKTSPKGFTLQPAALTVDLEEPQ